MHSEKFTLLNSPPLTLFSKEKYLRKCWLLCVAQRGSGYLHVLFCQIEMQAYLVLLHFTLLHFIEVVFFTNRRQNPPEAKSLCLASLLWSWTELAITPGHACRNFNLSYLSSPFLILFPFRCGSTFISGFYLIM